MFRKLLGSVREYKKATWLTLILIVAEAVIEELRPVRERYERYMNDKAYLKEVAAQGAARASRIADRTLQKVMNKVGFVLP